MKKLLAALAILGLAAATGSTRGQEKQSNALNALMLKKLKNAQLVLEGIAIADYAKITRGAEELLQASRQAEWFVFRTPRYQMHTNDFQRSAETMIQRAKDRNVEGAALAYFEMTMTCVRCHQHVRGIRDARAPAARDALFAFLNDTAH